MNEQELKLVIEALLVSSKKPLTLENIQHVFNELNRPSAEQIKQALKALESDYANRAVELKSVANGYRLQTKLHYSQWVEKLFTEKPSKYSQALLETLAIIAYKQPVTRGDIEEIRGVGVSSSMIRTLIDREWIRSAGHRDVPGKPAVYITTKQFLEHFNLQRLDDLPDLVMNELETTQH
jgi:segregation and condensation protein B